MESFVAHSQKNSLLKSVDPVFDFAEPANEIMPNAVNIIGFEFDGTACFRKGAKLGPNAIRAVSDGIESYSPYLDCDLEDTRFYDLGNIQINHYDYNDDTQTIHQVWQHASDNFSSVVTSRALANGAKVLTLGGEHSISYAPIKTYLQTYSDLVVIHLDAHADLRDGYEGYHYSHASIIRRIVDHFNATQSLLQYGIRSGTKAEYQWMNHHHTLIDSRATFLQRVAEIDDDRPIYLTLDLDYFDPSYFPGTGTPEPGGEDFHSFVSLCKLLKQKNLVGCDVVELAPNIDNTGNSSVFAAKVVRELILCMQDT